MRSQRRVLARLLNGRTIVRVTHSDGVHGYLVYLDGTVIGEAATLTELFRDPMNSPWGQADAG